MKKRNDHIGSDFDEFLEEEGILASVEATAIKRLIARQLSRAMKGGGLTKTMLAKKMRTSRSAVDRLLDPDNDSLSLTTLNRAAAALGKKLKIELM